MPSCGICLSHSCILSKSRQMFSNFFHYLEYPPFCFFPNQTLWQYSVECRCGRQKLRLSTNSWLWIDDCCSANNNCDGPPCSLRNRPPRISESLSPPCTTVTKRTERNNLAVLSIVAICKKKASSSDIRSCTQYRCNLQKKGFVVRYTKRLFCSDK